MNFGFDALRPLLSFTCVFCNFVVRVCTKQSHKNHHNRQRPPKVAPPHRVLGKPHLYVGLLGAVVILRCFFRVERDMPPSNTGKWCDGLPCTGRHGSEHPRLSADFHHAVHRGFVNSTPLSSPTRAARWPCVLAIRVARSTIGKVSCETVEGGCGCLLCRRLVARACPHNTSTPQLSQAEPSITW